jgi:uncharacterized membrane protein
MRAARTRAKIYSGKSPATRTGCSFHPGAGNVPSFAKGGVARKMQLLSPFDRQPMDSRSRSFAKALSWRATGSLDTMLLSFLITGNVKIAATIGLTEIVTKSLLYYAHERIWLKIPYGRTGEKKNTASGQTVTWEA